MKTLQSLEDVFNKKIFRIPDYQRGYAWGKKQLSDFWEDIVSLDGERFHYTGVLSIKAVPQEVWKDWNEELWLIEQRKYVPYYIVDGQQRLTTTSIFLQCLIEQIRDLDINIGLKDGDIYLGSYNLKEIKENFVMISQPPNNIINTYKFGYEADNPSFSFLRFKIFNEPSAGVLNETFYTLNLENAKGFFKENILKLYVIKGSSVLEELYEKITQRFMYNLYEISDDFDVFVAFETMNNRGKSLSDLELLKNRLIYLTTLYKKSEVKENDIIAIRENINDAWGQVYYQLGRNKNNPLNDDDFLRAHWIMYYKYSRKSGDDYIRYLLDDEFSPKKVLEKVEVITNSFVSIEEIRESEADVEDYEENYEENPKTSPTYISKLPLTEIHKYVLSLKAASKHWYNTWNPENNSDLAEEEQITIDRLNRIGMGYFRPLVMACLVREDIKEERIKLLNAIERFIFLEFRVSRAQSMYASSVFYNAARDLFFKNQTVEEIIKLIDGASKGMFNTDGTFKHSFFREFIHRKFSSGGSGFYGWNGLRYFLFEYEENLKKVRFQPKVSWKNFIKSEKDKVSIEHILPQTPTKDCWKNTFNSFSEEEIILLTGSLGNLLLLSSSINSSLQNDCFENKIDILKNTEGVVVRNGYLNGSYSEQEVASMPFWDAERILKRGIDLLKFFEKRWNVKFESEKAMIDLLHLNFMTDSKKEE
jgi:hypothetical protein